ncbi:unnamed protein product [Cladocopium goreaui]|uniref:Uncharacterized protein n=1 Tax=Cladocopium goreaui TaxID=2562237 RepID=A0A9P1C491_9DINO|nr:unnamed protein product [Cladocopium goreaui]
MSVTIGELEAGRQASAYDVLYDGKYMDMCSVEGFITAVYQTLNVRRGGAVTLAPVCSSWVWVSRHSTKRSKAAPLGDLSARSVQIGNLMVTRCRKGISEIAKFAPILGDTTDQKVELVRKYIDSKGVSRVAGTKALKGSQNYPLPFGRALAKVRTQLAPQCAKDAKQFYKAARKVKKNGLKNPSPCTKDFTKWVKHGKLGPCFDYLTS